MGRGSNSPIQKGQDKNELIEEEDSSNESSQSGDRIVPPDGGWGWMVVFSSFLIHMIADGIVYSFGVFLMEFVVYFKSGRSAASLIGALQPAVTFTVGVCLSSTPGPLASVLTNRYGCRKVTIAGALIAATGFVTSTFSPHLYYLYFTSGIMAGVGFGLIYLPAIVCVAQYFKKRRSFATGLAVCGSGFGTFILAPVIEMLVREFSWQGAMLILGGVILNVTVCGVIFRPLKASSCSRNEMSIDSEVEALTRSTNREECVSREHTNKTYEFKIEDLDKIIPGKYSADGNETYTNKVLTTSPTININNSLQSQTTTTNDKTEFTATNNFSNNSDDPSTSTIRKGLDGESTGSSDTNNTEEKRGSTGSSENYHVHGFKSNSNLYELKHTGNPSPESSRSLDYLLQSKYKQDSHIGPRYSQSAVNILHKIDQSNPSAIENSPGLLSESYNLDRVSEHQNDQDTSSCDRCNPSTAQEPPDSQETEPNSHNQQNTESKLTDLQNSIPTSQPSLSSSSNSHSSQTTSSKLHSKVENSDDILNTLADSSGSMSEQQNIQTPLSEDQHSQHNLSEYQDTENSGSDPSSTHFLVSASQHARAINAYSDSVVHLQLPLSYKLRTAVLARKSKSHSSLVTYSSLGCRNIPFLATLNNVTLYRPMPDVCPTVTSVPDHVIRSLSQQRKKKYLGCLVFSEDFRDALKGMMSLSLLRNPVFLMFAASNFLTSLGFNVPFIFLPDRAKLAGIDEKSAALLLSWIGIANTVGRVFFGFLSDRPWVNRLLLYNTALVICGVVTALSPLVGGDYALLVTYATIFGVFIGVYVSLTSIVLVDLLGLEALTNSFGLLLLFQGAATFVGSPFAGWLCDRTGSYDISFIVMGSLIAVSGCMLYFLPLVERYHRRHIVNTDPDQDNELDQKPTTIEDWKIPDKSEIISVV